MFLLTYTHFLHQIHTHSLQINIKFAGAKMWQESTVEIITERLEIKRLAQDHWAPVGMGFEDTISQT